MEQQTYASKSTARKGAKRKNLNLDILEFKQNNEGRWYWEEITAATETTEEVVSGKGIKIEKDRPEQNGVIRPSVGGKCRAIWDFCDDFLKNEGRLPMPKDMKSASEEHGWNKNNSVIEMYQWRRFNGYIGRQK